MPTYKTKAKYGTAEHTRRLRERTDMQFRDLFSAAYGSVMAYLEYRQLTGKKFKKGKVYEEMFLTPFEQELDGMTIRDTVCEEHTVFNSHYESKPDLMRRSFRVRRFLHRLWKEETDETERKMISSLVGKVAHINHIWMIYCPYTEEAEALDRECDKLHWDFKTLKDPNHMKPTVYTIKPGWTTLHKDVWERESRREKRNADARARRAAKKKPATKAVKKPSNKPTKGRKKKK